MFRRWQSFVRRVQFFKLIFKGFLKTFLDKRMRPSRILKICLKNVYFRNRKVTGGKYISSGGRHIINGDRHILTIWRPPNNKVALFSGECYITMRRMPDNWVAVVKAAATYLSGGHHIIICRLQHENVELSITIFVGFHFLFTFVQIHSLQFC